MTARILMTGSRGWRDPVASHDALLAAVSLVGSSPKNALLIHGAAAGADALLSQVATEAGLAIEAHPAQWNIHTDACPAWDRANSTCKLAGHRRNDVMIATGADVCLAFPTHGYELKPGEDRARTSRGTWGCADKSKSAGIPTLVVWGKNLFPFGHLGVQLLASAAQRKGISQGPAGELPILEAWLPF